ncbi:manganese ABC transporter substrate-binding protein/adhesin MntA [Bacillaceae bacterium]
MNGFHRYIAIVGFLLATAAFAGCGQPGTAQTDDDKVRAIATIGMITDVVKNVGGEHVAVTGLMGPGVDPHLYKATQGDIAKLQAAEIVFYNGLHLEGKMGDIFAKIAEDKPTIPVTEYIPQERLLSPPEFEGFYDPHVWFDVKLWMKAVERVRDGLSAVDPAHKADYERNAAAYLERLDALDRYVRGKLSAIPKERRVLVTAHDAFNYLGRAYDMEVVGLQGISTDAEYGLQDVQKLVGLLVERKIKAVFIESSVPRKSIEAVVEGAKAKGHEVAIGGELYSDALGEEGTEEGTYIGMVKHNVDTIVSALK